MKIMMSTESSYFITSLVLEMQLDLFSDTQVGSLTVSSHGVYFFKRVFYHVSLSELRLLFSKKHALGYTFGLLVVGQMTNVLLSGQFTASPFDKSLQVIRSR